MKRLARALTLVGALFASGCKDKGFGADCAVKTDCAEEFDCVQRYGASKREPHFCSKPCRLTEEEACPLKFHCELEPGSLRKGQCEPSNWAPP